jgi:LPS-assembly protein
MTLTADEVVYNEKTRVADARGNVVFERDDDRIEATEAHYQLGTGEGTFLKVRGTSGRPPKRSGQFLVTSSPFYFEAERVERRRDGSYMAYNGWVTNCRPGTRKWRMKAAQAAIRPGNDVRLRHASFHIGPVPTLYSPYSAISIADEPRQSGFLWPSFGNDSLRGTNIGAGYFWAINPHADLTFWAQWFNQGGWTQSAEFRALPTGKSRVRVAYFGAIAGKLKETQQRERNIGVTQSGQSAQIYAETKLPHGFRAVADLDFLSSMKFRLAFAETLYQAIQSEVKSTAFVTANPDTFYFNSYLRRYQNFLQADPEQVITLTSAPSFEGGTRPRLLKWFEKQPLYFSVDARAGGMRRDEPRYRTPELVQRYEIYPRVTVPLRLGRHIGFTPTFALRASRYGARVVDDPSAPNGKAVLNRPIRRITEEFTLDLRFPSLGRIYERGARRYKHVIEPEVTYRYVNGVRDFDQMLRFDEHDIITDTHEIEYGITQRLYVREAKGDGQAREVVMWRVAQKYYFDPDFRGALQPGVRNVFAALLSLTPLSFADAPRRFSPIVSTLRIMPRGRVDTDFRIDYDPVTSRILNTRLGVGARVTDLIGFSLTHYNTRGSEILQPRYNQLWLLARFGNLYRRGFNVAGGVSWDIRQDYLPGTTVQLSYNWDCCGVAFGYQRLGLGPLRSENQFRFSFTIANVGSFGTIERQNRIF